MTHAYPLQPGTQVTRIRHIVASVSFASRGLVSNLETSLKFLNIFSQIFTPMFVQQFQDSLLNFIKHGISILYTLASVFEPYVNSRVWNPC